MYKKHTPHTKKGSGRVVPFSRYRIFAGWTDLDCKVASSRIQLKFSLTIVICCVEVREEGRTQTEN